MPSATALLVLIVWIFFPTVLGNLYATRPISNSVYQAGKEDQIVWIDDGKPPHLTDMPKLQADLYNPDNVRPRLPYPPHPGQALITYRPLP